MTLKYMSRADLELYASPIRSGKGIGRSIPKENYETNLRVMPYAVPLSFLFLRHLSNKPKNPIISSVYAVTK